MIVVSDTSPLTALIQVGREELLRLLFVRVVIPPAVRDELLREHLHLPDWLQVKDPGAIPATLLSAPLDHGEAEAIALALRLQADTILMDERRGRRVASAHGLQPTGLLGCLVRAKQEGHLSSVWPVIAELQEVAGCWFESSLIKAVLQAAGELTPNAEADS